MPSLRKMLTSRFAHFGAPTPVASTEPEGETEEEKAKREEEEAAAAKKAEEEEEARKSRKARRARKARKKNKDQDGEDDDDAGDDDEEEDDEEEMKKAVAAGHELALDAAFRTGARAQRSRCAAIFAHASAAANPMLAMSLAFDTSMTATAAIAVLEKTPAPSGRATLAERMGTSGAVPRLGPSAPEVPRGAAAIAASWDAAAKAVTPPG